MADQIIVPGDFLLEAEAWKNNPSHFRWAELELTVFSAMELSGSGDGTSRTVRSVQSVPTSWDREIYT